MAGGEEMISESELLNICNKAITKAWAKQNPSQQTGIESDHINLLRYIVYLYDESPQLIKEIETTCPENSSIVYPYMNEPDNDHITWEALELFEKPFIMEVASRLFSKDALMWQTGGLN
jgi:hypothetical protein